MVIKPLLQFSFQSAPLRQGINIAECAIPKRVSFCFGLHANARVPEGPPHRSYRNSRVAEPLLIPKMLDKGPAGVFFAFSISFSVLFQVVAHILHTLSQSSAPPTFFQDSSSWCDLSNFELIGEAELSPSQQHAGKTLQLQQREGNVNKPAREPSKRTLSEGSLGPPKPVLPARHSTIPLVILRTKRHQGSPLATGDPRSFIFTDVSSSTPSRSPVKGLSFSPSQVEHGFCGAVTNFQHTIKA